MTTIATLAVKLIADASGFTSTLNTAESKAQSWATSVSQKMTSVGGSMQNMGMKATTFLTLPLVGAGIAAINYASDLEETKNKVIVVFGEMSGSVLDWSLTSAQAMGMSQNTALSAAGTFGNLFTTMGLGQDASADMSMGLVQLASDLASFNNLDPTEVLDKLRSGLVGEVEPLRALGINLNQTTVALKAMEMGLVETSVDMAKVNGILLDAEKAQNNYNKAVQKYGEGSLQAREAAQRQVEIQLKLDEATAGTTDEISAGALAQARYALILEQSANAAGDFANTASGLANQQRILKAEFQNAAAALGMQLLPYALQFVQWVSGLIEKFQALTPEQQKWIIGIGVALAILGPLLMIIGTLVTAIGAIIGALAVPLSATMAAIVGAILPIILIIAALYLAWTNNWGGIQEKTAAVWAWLQPILQDIWNWLSVNIPIAIQTVSDFWKNTLVPAVQSAWNFVKNIIDSALQFIADLNSGKLGWISQVWQNTWNTIKLYVDTVITNIKLLQMAFQAAMSGDWYRFGELLRIIWDNSWRMIGIILSTAWTNIKLIVSNLINDVKNFFTTTDWGELGRMIVVGIVNGLQSMAQWALDQIVSFGQAIAEVLAGFFGIHSESKLMHDYIGTNLALGTIGGWNDTLTPSMFTPALATATTTSFDSVPAIRSRGSGGGGGGVVVQFTYSPAVSLGDRYEAEQVLAPMIADAVRRRLEQEA